MVYVAGVAAAILAVVGVVLAAQRRLGRGFLAFAILQLFGLFVALAFAAAQPPSAPRWVMILGALVIGPLFFLRYYQRGGDR